VTEYDTALAQWLVGTDASGERASASPASPRRFGLARRNAADAAALERVRAWTRARFSLDDDTAIMVAELACTVPGCPPRETVIAFWTAPDRRHHFKIFKPAAEIVSDDLPPAWLKDALVVAEGECDCC
jgi:nitrate reductase delta subunit